MKYLIISVETEVAVFLFYFFAPLNNYFLLPQQIYIMILFF